MPNLTDYRRSNRVTAYTLEPDVACRAALQALMSVTTAEDRERFGADLLASLSALTGCQPPKLRVLDRPRPHRLKDGRIVYQQHGNYSGRTKTIRIQNLTARRLKPVAPKTFLETLIHELMHHWDYEVLGLRRSLHSSGFYHRLGSVKASVAK